MTLQVIEGFDHMSTSDLMDSKNWTFSNPASGGPVWTNGFTTGRVIGNSFYLQMPSSTVTSVRFYKTLPATYDHFVVGFAFQCQLLPALGSSGQIFAVTTDGAVDVARIRVFADGSIGVFDSAGSSVATSATGIFTARAWHFIEMKMVINGALGSVNVHLNGVEVIATTTHNFGSTPIQYIGPYSESNNGWPTQIGTQILFYDDLYLLDTSASPNNDYLGDCHVETLFPNADGDHSDWTPDTGIVHFSRVNEKTGTFPDGDTSYVKASTVGNKDTWEYDDLTITSGTVFGLQTNLYIRKYDTNLRQARALARPTTTDYHGSTHTVASGYVDFTDIFDTNPETAVAWTVSDVNAGEWGVEVVT